MAMGRVDWRASGRGLGLAAATGAVMFLAAGAGLVLLPGEDGFPTIWPLSGVLLSAFLLREVRVWPSLFLLALASNMAAFVLVQKPPWTGLIVGLACSAQSALGAWLLRRFLGAPPAFENLREVVGFVVWPVFLANLAASPVGALAFGVGFGGSISTAWIAWLLASGVGILLLTPLILTWGPVLRGSAVPALHRGLEAAALAVSLALATAWVFADREDSSGLNFRPPFAMFPFLLWACFRFGPRGASASMFLLVSLAMGLVSLQGRRFTSFLPVGDGGALGLQVLFCLIEICCLSIAAVDRERRSAVTGLAQEAGRFRLLAGVIDESSFCTLDRDGRVTTWSEGAEKLQGYQAAVIIGRPFECLFPPEDCQRGRPSRILRRAAGSTQRIREEGWRLRQDGSTFWAESVITPLRNAGGMLTGYSDLTRDISDRLRAERELRMSHERFRLLSRASYEAVYDRNFSTGQFWWNEGMREIFGYVFSEVNPDLAWWSDRIHPEDKQRVLAGLNRSVGSGEQRWESEYRFRRADGAYAYVLDRGYLMRADDGKEVRMIGAILDLTQRRKAEEEIRSFKEELEARVEKRTVELARKNKDLEAFTYSVSHDLKAPLRGIDGYARILREEYAGSLGEPGCRYLDNICQAVRQMARLIEDLLRYARLDQGDAQFVSQDVVTLVHQAVAEREKELKLRRIETIQDVIPAEIQVDPEGLLQALRNILDNAIKFTRESPAARIEIQGRPKDESYLLSVRDNGIGFDMKFHDRIFEIFQRLERNENYPGTGVGLAIVKRAIDRLGGRVWGESSPGQGATFFMELSK